MDKITFGYKSNINQSAADLHFMTGFNWSLKVHPFSQSDRYCLSRSYGSYTGHDIITALLITLVLWVRPDSCSYLPRSVLGIAQGSGFRGRSHFDRIDPCAGLVGAGLNWLQPGRHSSVLSLLVIHLHQKLLISS